MDTKKDESQHCDDCKICTMVEHCDRAFMRAPANCEDYKLAHVDDAAPAATNEEIRMKNEEVGEKAAPEEIAREAVSNGFYSPNEAAYRVLGEPTHEMVEAEEAAPETAEESKESIMVSDSNGNEIARYGSVKEHIAAMEKVVEECAQVRQDYDEMCARLNRDSVVIDQKKVSAEEFAAFKFLLGALDENSPTKEYRVAACVPTGCGNYLLTRNYNSAHAINVELFEFQPNQTYRAFKNKGGLAFVPTFIDGFDFERVRVRLCELLDIGNARKLAYFPKCDFTEWLYHAGADGLPAHSAEQLKPLTAFATPWTMHIPTEVEKGTIFVNGTCYAFLKPLVFSVDHRKGLALKAQKEAGNE